MVERGGERRTHYSCGREQVRRGGRERGRESAACAGGRGRSVGCGGLSIASVERKREWERDEERGEVRGRGVYSGTSSLSTTESYNVV